MSAAWIMTGLPLPRPNWTVNPWDGPHFSGEVGIGKEHRPGWDLTLTVRVELVFVIPPSGPATFQASEAMPNGRVRTVNLTRWTAAETTLFRQKFERNVRAVWDNRLVVYLRSALDEPTPGMLPDPAADPAKIFNCRFRVETQAPFHISLTVAKHPSGQAGFTPRLNPDGLEGATNGYINFEDADFQVRPGTAQIRHNRAAHEIGHLLGLKHPNESDPQCVANPHHVICYGRDQWERLEVEGLGLKVLPKHATPWMEALGHIAGASTALMTAYPMPKK